jgi:putative ABC transport system ATP-binding protein
MQLQGVPAGERRRRAEAVLDEVGLAGLGGRRPAELSGGQQQRIAVARAIVSRPAIVLADEPTANLDSVTALELLKTMQALNRSHGTTFIVATHDVQVIEFTRRRVRMRDGRIQQDEG